MTDKSPLPRTEPLHLRVLDPKLADNGVLRFDCPNPDCCHVIRIETGADKPWSVGGKWPDITVSPSINAGCWHGWISGGWVRNA